LQEEMSGAVPWFHDVIKGPIHMVEGHWQVPTAPGLGVEIDMEVAARHPYSRAAEPAPLPLNRPSRHRSPSSYAGL
jgi:galactonate dehydratase